MEENQKYYSKEDVDRKISEMNKSIKSLKKRDFYTKKQVDTIIESIVNSIKLGIKEMNESDTESLPNCFRLNPTEINPTKKEVFRASLYDGLLKEGFISTDTKLDDFKRVFSGKENDDDAFRKIKWKGSSQSAVYLIVKLGGGPSWKNDNRIKIIDDWSSDNRKFTKKMLAFFEGMHRSSISNQVSKSREQIEYSGLGEDIIRDATKIDTIIENAIKKNKIT